MTASLRVKNGYFQMIFSYKDSSGRWKKKSESTGLKERGNKRKAESMMKKRLEELEAQGTKKIETFNTLFLEVMEEWLNEVMINQVRENTLDEYKRMFSYHLKTYQIFQELLLQDLTPRILQNYYNTKLKNGLSPNSILKQHANISKFLKYAVSLDMIDRNPADRITLPKKVKSTAAHFYTATQLQALLDLFVGDPLETVVFLTANFGLRRSEVCGLRWDAIDFEKKLLHIRHTAIVVNGKILYADSTKSNSSNRILPIGDAVQNFLKGVQKKQEEMRALIGKGYIESGYICTKDDGSPINPDFVTHHFQRVVKGSDLPLIRFHDLRHSAASLLHNCGYNLKDIQTWLGHSDIQTTGNIYTHLEDSRMVGMANAMGNALEEK